MRALFSDINENRNFHKSCLSSPLKILVGGYFKILCIDLIAKENVYITSVDARERESLKTKTEEITSDTRWNMNQQNQKFVS